MTNRHNKTSYSAVDLISIVVNRLNLIVILVFLCTLTFVVQGLLFQKPLYQSSAKMIKSINSFNYLSHERNLQSNSTISLPLINVPDLSNSELLPAIIKSDVFINRLLHKKFDSNQSNERTSLFLLMSDKGIKENSRKQRVAKSNLKKLITLNNNESVMSLNIKANDPNLAKDLANKIINELNEINFLFRKNTFTARKNIIAKKIETVEKKLKISEKNLETFLLTNKRIDSAGLKMKKNSMEQDIELNKSIFFELARYHDMLNLEANSRSKGAISILDYPQTPISPINDNIMKLSIKGALFGLILSFFLIFLRIFYIEKNDTLIYKNRNS